MTKDPFTIDPAAPRGTANEVMQARGLRHLPVVVDDSRLIGAVTDRDLRHAALASFIGEFLSVSSQGRLRQLDDTLDDLKVRSRRLPVVAIDHVEVHLPNARDARPGSDCC